MNAPTDLPYRITVEIAVGPGQKDRVLVLEGVTDPVADPFTDMGLAAIAANALIYQSHALAVHANWFAQYDAMRRAMNLPVNSRPF